MQKPKNRRTTPPDALPASAYGVCQPLAVGDYALLKTHPLQLVCADSVAVLMQDAGKQLAGVAHLRLPPGLALSQRLACGHAQLQGLLGALAAAGARQQALQARLFGNAQLLPDLFGKNQQTLSFVVEYMKSESIAIIQQEVGGLLPRCLYITPHAHAVERHYLRRSGDAEWFYPQGG